LQSILFKERYYNPGNGTSLTDEIMKIDFKQVDNIELDGVDPKDYPDFCDAFIASCDYKGREATDEELDAINEQCDYIHELAFESLI